MLQVMMMQTELKISDIAFCGAAWNLFEELIEKLETCRSSIEALDAGCDIRFSCLGRILMILL
jgi:hypothetical protein